MYMRLHCVHRRVQGVQESVLCLLESVICPQGGGTYVQERVECNMFTGRSIMGTGECNGATVEGKYLHESAMCLQKSAIY